MECWIKLWRLVNEGPLDRKTTTLPWLYILIKFDVIFPKLPLHVSTTQGIRKSYRQPL